MTARLPAGLRWRLAGAVLAVCGLAAAALLGLLQHADRYAQQQALDDAERHVASRVRSMDQGWRAGAFAIARQLDLWLAAGPPADAATREARAHVWLVTALDQADFTHAMVEDMAGRVLLQHGSRAQAVPVPAPGSEQLPLAWAWSEADALAYRRVDAGTLRWGTTPARLLLYAPLDNALIARLGYPGNEVSVWRGGQRLAATPAASRPAGVREVMQALPWDTLPGAPELHVLRTFEPVFATGGLLATMAGATAALVAVLWLVLGRWVGRQAARTQALQAAAAAYGHAGGLSAAARAELQAVAAEPDALGLLAHDLAGMMARIDDARHALQQANATLEDRVAERTRALADGERFLRTLADSVPALIAYWGPDDRCRFANEMHRTWFGRSPAQMLGLTLQELLGDAIWQARQGERAGVLAGRPQSFEIDLPRAGGGTAQLQVQLAPDLDGSAVRGYTVVAVDVTALAGARAEAQAAAHAKSLFLANMSHEIRTPMNAIIGLTHLLTRDATDTLQRERLARIDGAARHLLQVINDILDLSKIDAGKVVLEEVDFDVEALMRRVVEIAGGAARDKRLELVVDTDALPERLRGDPTRLAQVLINLLGNAAKFTEAGHISLRARVQRRESSAWLVRFEVQDTGPGIAPERQASLFQAFEQLDASTTRRHGGTGLGLALVRHLSRLMGGEAGVDSAPGAGSTFWFTARLGRAAEAGDHAAPLQLAGLRALLVDDLADARAAIGDRLQALGLVVDAQPGGAEALAQVERAMADGRPYDVLLVDWRMPEPDGIDTLLALRRLLGDGMPPAALVTAYDDPALAARARAAGAQALLAKPVTASTLLDTLVRLLRPAGVALASTPQAAGEAETLLRQRHAGQHVLLVEDNAVNREVALEMLAHAGLVVDSAENGQQAVELATTRRYDLVLMDVQMPVLDGLEATRRIRAAGQAALPVVAMTANAFGEDRQACLEAGMNDHLAKPVDPETLFAMLLRWLPLRQRAVLGDAPVPPPAPEHAIARYAGVPGMDVAEALARCGGRGSMLQRVLRRFVQTYANGLPALREGGPAQWIEAAHSLRGACATVGLRGLVARLQAFEEAAASDGDRVALAAEAVAIDAELCRVVVAALRALEEAAPA